MFGLVENACPCSPIVSIRFSRFSRLMMLRYRVVLPLLFVLERYVLVGWGILL